jgi:hypothetical protein
MCDGFLNRKLKKEKDREGERIA